jgi:hypothetical protein
MGSSSVAGRHLGITIMPEYVQCEGIDAVLDRLERLGVTAVTTMPSVAVEVPEGQGSREPPIDGGAGGVRILDRALWGKQALHIVTAPSFEPDRARYRGLAYQPPPPSELTAAEGPVVARFIAAAQARGMKVYLQVMAAIPPCYRVQFGGPLPGDRPMLPGGVPLPGRVDNNASLASGAVRDYVRVMIADLLSAYPDIDGLRFDWPEYPPYHPLSLLADYNPQVRPYAEAFGLDFYRLERQMQALPQRLGDALVPLLETSVDFGAALDGLVALEPSLADHLSLRRHLVEDYASHLCNCVAEASGGRQQVFLQGFPPPWSTLSGFTPEHMAGIADLVGIKFYTMHWPMMLRHYVQQLGGAIGTDRDALARVIHRLFVPGAAPVRGLGDLVYPEPDQPHGVGAAAIKAKFDLARSPSAPDLIAITHGYGPLPDVVDRLRACWIASGGRVEINRYGYLSDAKLDAIRAALDASPLAAPPGR